VKFKHHDFRAGIWLDMANEFGDDAAEGQPDVIVAPPE
jgi:hypothetical protein